MRPWHSGHHEWRGSAARNGGRCARPLGGRPTASAAKVRYRAAPQQAVFPSEGARGHPRPAKERPDCRRSWKVLQAIGARLQSWRSPAPARLEQDSHKTLTVAQTALHWRTRYGIQTSNPNEDCFNMTTRRMRIVRQTLLKAPPPRFCRAIQARRVGAEPDFRTRHLSVMQAVHKHRSNSAGCMPLTHQTTPHPTDRESIA